MNSNKKIQKIKELIEENEIEEALNSLSDLEDYHEIENDIILLKRRYNKLQNNKIRDIISQEDYNLEDNKIITNLIELLDSEIIRSKNYPGLSYKSGKKRYWFYRKIEIQYQEETISIRLCSILFITLILVNRRRPILNFNMFKYNEEILLKKRLTGLNIDILMTTYYNPVWGHIEKQTFEKHEKQI